MTLGELALKVVLKTQGLSALGNIKKDVDSTAKDIKPKIENLGSAWGKLGESFQKIGKKSSEFFKGIKSKGSDLKDLATDIRKSHLMILATASALVGIVKKASDVAASLTKFHNLTGLSTKNLQALQQQAAGSGVSPEEVTSSIQSLQQASQDIALGKGNIAPWAVLGIDPRQDPFKVINDLQRVVNNFSPARFTSLARELNLSEDMINFIKEAKSLGSSDQSLLLSDKEIKKLKEFNILFNKAWDNSKRSIQKLAVSLKPLAESLVFAWHRFNLTIITVSQSLSYLAEQFGFIFKIITAIGALILVAFFPLTAALVLLGLAIDDIAGWVRGDDSLIGSFIGKFTTWREELERIRDIIKSTQEAVKGLFSIKEWKKFFDLDLLKTKSLGQENIDAYAAQDRANSAKNWEDFKSFFGFGESKETNIHIYGATSPEASGNAVKEVIEKDNRNTMYQQKIGVK